MRRRRRTPAAYRPMYHPNATDDKNLFLEHRKWYAPYFDLGLIKLSRGNIPTPAKVSLIKGKFQDYYQIEISANLEKFMGKDALGVPTVVGEEHIVHLIEHELWHVINRHFDRIPPELSCMARGKGCKDCPGKKKLKCHKLWQKLQVSNDLAINSLLGKRDLDRELEGQNPSLYGWPELLSSEAYFEMLKKRKSSRKRQDWEDLEGTVIAIMVDTGEGSSAGDKLKEMQMQTLMGEAAKQSSEKAIEERKKDDDYDMYGTTSADLSRIARMLSEVSGHGINWDRLVKCGILKGSKPMLVYKRYKIDKRYHTMPGTALKLKAKPLIGIDTSGSIIPEQFALFMRKVNGMNFPDALVAECDAMIKQTYKLGKGLKQDHKFMGGGGTDFRPIFELAKQQGFNTVIYFTDGNGSYPDQDPGIPTIWVISGGRCGVTWGQEIYLD